MLWVVVKCKTFLLDGPYKTFSHWRSTAAKTFLQTFCYDSTQRSVAGGIMFNVFVLFIRASVHPKTLLTRYLAEYIFDTFSANVRQHALWDRDERFTVWDLKVKGQADTLE